MPRYFAMIAIATIFLAGCSWLGPQSYKHVIEDKTGAIGSDGKDRRVGTLALVAQRRMVLVKFADGTFCAEPPPDAVDNLSAAVSAALAAQSTQNASVSASAAASLASYAKQLFYRSQGLQLYRDGAFALCTMSLNRKISTDQLLNEHAKLLQAATGLIATEIPELKSIKADLTGAPLIPASAATATASNPPAKTASAPVSQ